MSAVAQLLTERQTGIGGSDIAAVFNIGYGCARRLWMQKRNVEPDYQRIETLPMKRGRRLEELAADEYRDRTGREVIHVGMIRHENFPELLVHMDREIHKENRPDPGALEIKVLGREMFYRVKRDGLAHDYILQLQHAMLVTGYRWGAFAVLWADGWQLLHWDVERDEKLCELIRDESLKFWASVENGPMPDRLEASDRRCHACEYRTSCQGNALLESAKADPVDGDIPFDSELSSLVRDYQEAHEIGKEANDYLEQVKKRIKEALGARKVVDTNGYRIYFTAQQVSGYTVKPFVKQPLRIFAK